jgi:hypothetical protein
MLAWWSLALGAGGGLGGSSASAMEGVQVAATVSEPDLKASYLTKLPLFVSWPEGTFPTRGSPVVIGILGDDPFGPAFDVALASLRTGERPFQVRRFAEIAAVDGCHILYVGRSEQGQVGALLAAFGRRPVLTVGDFPGFAVAGGMFNFAVGDDGRVRFECNREAVRRGNLKVSGKLLQISRIVRDGGGASAP